MEGLTLGQIGAAITFIVGLISGVAYLSSMSRRWIRLVLDEKIREVDTKLNEIATRIGQVDMESCKNYLVQVLSSVEKGNTLDEIEKERFYEQLQHYQNIGGNSYIKRKVEELKSKNMI